MQGDNELELRRLLWAYHMHKRGTQALLYGDDGELQCNACLIDFKRDSIESIQNKLIKEIYK